MDLICRIKKINRNWQWLFVVVFMATVIGEAWMSDDAYHAFTMAKNLANGNGFVYNIGYRVNATTCPLYTLLVAVVYKLIGDMYMSGLILNVLFSVSAFYMVISRACKNVIQMFLFTISIIGCYSFMCYTTSGLENSMLFFVGTIFVLALENIDIQGKRRLLLTSFGIGILAFIRMDSVIVFSVVAVYVYCNEKGVKWLHKFVYGIVGMLPFIFWELFSFVYYGYLFPNTMYVKLNTGFAKNEYIYRGINYLRYSICVDIILLVVMILFISNSILQKNKMGIMTSIGVILYVVYIVYIGGDFMVGRHLTYPFWVSYTYLIILICDNKKLYAEKILLVLAMLQVIWMNTVQVNLLGDLDNQIFNFNKFGIADEKNFYLPYTGFFIFLDNKINRDDENIQFVSLYGKMLADEDSRSKGIVSEWMPGIVACYSADYYSFYLTDKFGLMDPLLSKLPAQYEHNWRIGHMYRNIPEGYVESVESGYNRIVNPSLHDYYDYVLKIVHDDVFSVERMRIIIEMNKGDYDYLIDEYLSNVKL